MSLLDLNGGSAFRTTVNEYLLNHQRVINACDDLNRPVRFPAGQDIDVEHPLETLRPAHGRPSFGGGLMLPSSVTLGSLPILYLPGVTHARCLRLGANTP